MNTREAIKQTLDTAEMISLMILEDMTDAELLKRPCEGCNHTNWQLGHLIVSENSLVEKAAPGEMPPLPAGFAEKYGRDHDKNDDPNFFVKKDELLKTYREQRAATLAAMGKLSDADFDKQTGLPYAPTMGSLFSMQGSHWLMHCGQWSVVRRQLGRPAKF